MQKLTKNITKDHILEIFSNFGNVTSCEVPVERDRSWINMGKAYVEFEKIEEAEEAVKKMDGGKKILCLQKGRGQRPESLYIQISVVFWISIQIT